jgi:hypothetical protein
VRDRGGARCHKWIGTPISVGEGSEARGTLTSRTAPGNRIHADENPIEVSERAG